MKLQQYQNGRGYKQVIENHSSSKMPKISIAVLELRDLDEYIGHHFCQTYTILVDGGITGYRTMKTINLLIILLITINTTINNN